MAFRDIIPECLLGEPNLLALYCYLLRNVVGRPTKTIVGGELIPLAANELCDSVEGISAYLGRSESEIERLLGLLAGLDLIIVRPLGMKRLIALLGLSNSLMSDRWSEFNRQVKTLEAREVTPSQHLKWDDFESRPRSSEYTQTLKSPVGLLTDRVKNEQPGGSVGGTQDHDSLFPNLPSVIAPNAGGDNSVREFSKEYLNYVSMNLSRKTYDNAERVMRLFCTRFGDTPMESLRLEHLEQFKQSRKQAGVSNTTVNIDIRTIKAAMNVAVDMERIGRNPFAKAKQLKVEEHRKKILSKDEFSRILKAIKEEWFYDIIAFNVLTGLRLGEIMNLKWADYDIPNKSVTVQSSDGYRVKGGKMRDVSLCPDAIALLDALPKLGEWIFLGKDGHRYTSSHVSKKFKKYLRQLGFPEEMHYHRLRDTFCTWMADAGVPPHIIKELAGHSSLHVTEGYLTPNAEAKKSAAKKMRLPRIENASPSKRPVGQVHVGPIAVQAG
jgi:integrase